MIPEQPRELLERERDYWKALSTQHRRERDELRVAYEKDHHRRLAGVSEIIWAPVERQTKRLMRRHVADEKAALVRQEPPEPPPTIRPIKRKSWVRRLISRQRSEQPDTSQR